MKRPWRRATHHTTISRHTAHTEHYHTMAWKTPRRHSDGRGGKQHELPGGSRWDRWVSSPNLQNAQQWVKESGEGKIGCKRHKTCCLGPRWVIGIKWRSHVKLLISREHKTRRSSSSSLPSFLFLSPFIFTSPLIWVFILLSYFPFLHIPFIIIPIQPLDLWPWFTTSF
jgi:hypothetical protein